MFPKHPIILVDDEKHILKSMEFFFKTKAITNIKSFYDPSHALDFIVQNPVSVVVTDLIMPGINGDELLAKIKQHKNIPVIVVTGINELETAVNCMKDGASDYIVKPVDENRLLISVKQAVDLYESEIVRKSIEESFINQRQGDNPCFQQITTADNDMKRIFSYAQAVSFSSRPVLITGETGTGKELMASAIHCASGRNGKFVALNTAGLDDTVFSDTLFGHKKGAFTGADSERKGLIEEAAGGTLFLDEIGDIQASSQMKLLRLIQESQFYPLGSDIPKNADIRIIAATNRGTDELKQSNNFRSDLYYRLCTHHIHLPPLRERKSDILLLCEAFLKEAVSEMKKEDIKIDDQFYSELYGYDFPGNIRELKSLVYDAVASAVDTVMPPGLIQKSPRISVSSVRQFPAVLPTLAEWEQELIRESLRRTDGNVSAAAAMLGITRQTLARKKEEC